MQPPELLHTHKLLTLPACSPNALRRQPSLSYSVLTRKYIRKDRQSLACIKPMCRFFKYLAQTSFPFSKSLRSNYPATRFYCSLLMFQSLLLLSFTARFMFCVALQHLDWKDYCLHLRPFQSLCCASSYQILLWTQNLMKFSLSLCCSAFQLLFLNFQRVQKLKQDQSNDSRSESYT